MFTACFHGQRVAALIAMSPLLRRLLVALLIAVGLGVSAPASALTLDEVVALAKSGVSDAVILALIDRDKTIFAIEPAQIAKLQRDGLSEAVILALLKSGRAEGDEAARADAANNAAFIASTLSPGPEVVIVGHGPERPDVPEHSFYASPPIPIFTVPYVGPFAATYRNHAARPHSARKTSEPRALCYAEARTAASVKPLTYVTECPGGVQRR